MLEVDFVEKYFADHERRDRQAPVASIRRWLRTSSASENVAEASDHVMRPACTGAMRRASRTRNKENPDRATGRGCDQ
jgi:hypothetical protein